MVIEVGHLYPIPRSLSWIQGSSPKHVEAAGWPQPGSASLGKGDWNSGFPEATAGTLQEAHSPPHPHTHTLLIFVSVHFDH